MASQIQQDQAIDTALNHIRDTKQQLDSVRNTVTGDIQGNLASGFQGQGGSGFQQMHQAWHDKHVQVSNVLDELANALQNARKKGQSADEEVSHQVSGQTSYMDQFSTRL